jgi:hypothetical protein
MTPPLPSPLDQPIDVIIVDFDKPHCLSCLYARPLRRGLCFTCYERNRRRGTTDWLPRAIRLRDDWLDEVEHLRESRVPVREMPHRLGVSVAAFERAMFRARAAGDRRAAGFKGMSS